MTDRLALIRRTLEAHDQEHLLRFASDLDPGGRARLLDEIDSIDFDALEEAIRTAVQPASGAPAAPSFEPAPVHPYQSSLPGGGDGGGGGTGDDAAGYREAGEALVRSGRIAAFTVAGGQGTRLGWSGPKGTYPGSVVTGKPLFRCFAEQIVSAQRKYGVEIPWYIMTSPANDAETRAFFLDNNWFGLARRNVMTFPQGMMPSIDRATGAVLLADRDRIAMNPDGHGGAIRALRASGALDDMRARGIEHVSYFQVDNPLARVIDPVFIGLHADAPDSSGEMSSKAVAKVAPDEPVGVLVRDPVGGGDGDGDRDADGGGRGGRRGRGGGRTRIIEYSDLPPALARERDGEGRLRFRAGSIAIHLLGVGFAERLTSDRRFALPYHRALKRVPCVDPETGRRVEPEEPNAVKLETFVFDALPMAEASIVYETDRTEEFAPIKNASGSDSPATSRQIQSDRAGRWLEAHGVVVPRDDEGRVAARIEISPLTALEPADLVAVDLPDVIAPGEEVVL